MQMSLGSGTNGKGLRMPQRGWGGLLKSSPMASLSSEVCHCWLDSGTCCLLGQFGGSDLPTVTAPARVPLVPPGAAGTSGHALCWSPACRRQPCSVPWLLAPAQPRSASTC